MGMSFTMMIVLNKSMEMYLPFGVFKRINPCELEGKLSNKDSSGQNIWKNEKGQGPTFVAMCHTSCCSVLVQELDSTSIFIWHTEGWAKMSTKDEC